MFPPTGPEFVTRYRDGQEPEIVNRDSGETLLGKMPEGQTAVTSADVWFVTDITESGWIPVARREPKPEDFSSPAPVVEIKDETSLEEGSAVVTWFSGFCYFNVLNWRGENITHWRKP